MAAADSFLSFPENTLTPEPVKLPLVAKGDAWFAVTKPAGLPWRPDTWIERPTDIVREIRRQLREGKPQLARLGIDGIHGITGPDLVASGLVLFARTDAEADRLANALGSEQVELTYTFLTRSRIEHDRVTCSLPITPHLVEPRMIVSHAHGKKTVTHFRHVKRFRGFGLWTATTKFDRVHQLRVHATEVGLPIVGESRYGAVPSVYLSEVKKDYRNTTWRGELPLYGELCLHLGKITFPDANGSKRTIEVPLPKPFAVLLKRLDEYAGAGAGFQ